MIALALAAAAAEPGALPLLGDGSLVPFGFVDVGWFATAGNGSSYVESFASSPPGTTPTCTPPVDRADLDGWSECYGWVYTGDPWAAMVNSQGDVADLGNPFNDLQRFDRIASGGRPTFLVNAVEVGSRITAGDTVTAEAALLVEPGNGDAGAPGDWVSISQAKVEWRPTGGTRLTAGKMESAFGLEWWQRRSPDRWNITPSLMARYTTGTPVGVMGTVQNRDLRFDLAITNGGTTTERFGAFENEIDVNGVPTVTTRFGAEADAGKAVLGFGVSGQAGAMDGSEEVVPMVQVGGDLSASRVGPLFVRAEYLFTDQDQGTFLTADRLFAHGGYLMVMAQIGRFRPLVRCDRRAATLELARESHVYLSDVLRLTAGASYVPDTHLALKAEAFHLWELLGAPIASDGVTTSLVFQY